MKFYWAWTCKVFDFRKLLLLLVFEKSPQLCLLLLPLVPPSLETSGITVLWTSYLELHLCMVSAMGINNQSNLLWL